MDGVGVVLLCVALRVWIGIRHSDAKGQPPQTPPEAGGPADSHADESDRELLAKNARDGVRRGALSERERLDWTISTMKYNQKLGRTLAAIPFVIGSLTGGGNSAVIVEAVIVENAIVNSTLGGSGFVAQSFTTDSRAWSDISFSWLTANDASELAAGNLFLLDQEYLGAPRDISSLAPGFVAESSILLDGSYVFLPDVVLAPNTQYWACMGSDASFAGGGYNNASNYSGGAFYQTSPFGSSAANYGIRSNVDAAFRVSGVVVPEPSTTLFLVLGALGVLVTRRRMAWYPRRTLPTGGRSSLLATMSPL